LRLIVKWTNFSVLCLWT